MDTAALKLQAFRTALYTHFLKRKDAIMNLLDALTSHGRQCNSIVQLSNASCFERQYSSITDAIADGLPDAKWSAIRKLVYQQMDGDRDKKPHRFIIDCTPNPRPHAKKLVDRHITHAPNPAPGNKPICVGHQYSVLALLPNEVAAEKKHWVIPLSTKRVQSTQKGNEVGMQQIIDSIQELGLTDALCISIGDTLYGTENCRRTAAKEANLVHIFRLNSKRNVFFTPAEPKNAASKKGRKKEFGDKMNLKDSTTHVACHEEVKTPWVTRKGETYTVTLQCWKDMLLRGSRKFRSSQHPLNIIRISVTNTQGEAVFKRPLWVGVLGKRRQEVALMDVYKNYSSRYDIEHFFRFGKRNLLMDAYQTADVTHEELWGQLCTLSYMQLFLAKGSVPGMPQPWERYLPEYKSLQNKEEIVATPSQTQRGFTDLLNTIGTPAMPCVARGKPRGRIAGDIQSKREEHPIIFKTKKTVGEKVEGILQGSTSADHSPDPQRIEDLIHWVQSSLEKLDMTASEFSKMLIDSS